MPHTALPPLESEALDQSRRLAHLIRGEMARQGGRLPFDRYMELALYAPGLGYYTGGSRKFGEAGDFVTAPEISPLFGRCLARQCAEVLQTMQGMGAVLEFGAGSGALAADMLLELESIRCLPERYLILELSAELQQRQRHRIEARAPHLLGRVEWLQGMPEVFRGVAVANELLDAMPVHRFRIEQGEVREIFARPAGEGFSFFADEVASAGLEAAVRRLQAEGYATDDGYSSEINLRIEPWLGALAAAMQSGTILLIDYGYPRAAYYHPERSAGTLTCHHRHRVHDDPGIRVGLQDITAHVDFTAVAEAGSAAGFSVMGYTTQAHFLLASGLEALMMDSDPVDVAAHMEITQGVKRLTLPSEMGERFKVIALGKGAEGPLMGFGLRDLRDRL